MRSSARCRRAEAEALRHGHCARQSIPFSWLREPPGRCGQTPELRASAVGAPPTPLQWRLPSSPSARVLLRCSARAALATWRVLTRFGGSEASHPRSALLISGMLYGVPHAESATVSAERRDGRSISVFPFAPWLLGILANSYSAVFAVWSSGPSLDVRVRPDGPARSEFERESAVVPERRGPV